MNGRSIIILVLAGVSGLGAMVGVNQLMSKGETKAPEMQNVLVAARDLKAEEVLKGELVKLVPKPKSSLPEGTLTSVEECTDRWVNTKILAGEPIIEAKLAAKGTPPGLVAAIPKGKRAFAIEVNEQTGVSGFILPQHRVDVIQTKTTHSDSRVESDTILQNVLVLAVGQTSTRPEDKSIIVRTVTFAVTPEEVQELVEARARGPLSLSLRGVNDNETVQQHKPEPEKPPEPVKPPEPLPPAPIIVAEDPPVPEKRKVIHIFRGPPGPNSHQVMTAGRRESDDETTDDDEDSGGLAVIPRVKRGRSQGTQGLAQPKEIPPAGQAGDSPP